MSTRTTKGKQLSPILFLQTLVADNYQGTGEGSLIARCAPGGRPPPSYGEQGRSSSARPSKSFPDGPSVPRPAQEGAMRERSRRVWHSWDRSHDQLKQAGRARPVSLHRRDRLRSSARSYAQMFFFYGSDLRFALPGFPSTRAGCSVECLDSCTTHNPS
jgi:hypothetical protein